MLAIREDLTKLRKSGFTLKEISKRKGISTERVRQIISGNNNKKISTVSIISPLSTGDVARLLNIHVNTVRRWSKNGLLRTYRIGPRRDRRFKMVDVKKLIESF